MANAVNAAADEAQISKSFAGLMYFIRALPINRPDINNNKPIESRTEALFLVRVEYSWLYRIKKLPIPICAPTYSPRAIIPSLKFLYFNMFFNVLLIGILELAGSFVIVKKNEIRIKTNSMNAVTQK